MLQPPAPTTGLILSGGGARAAYQVGVLAAIADLLPDAAHNPFPVIVGTSAGATNAVGLASGSLHFTQAVRRLTEVWQGFHCHDVFRTDWPGLVRQAARFVGRGVLGLGRPAPVALLDSSPLRALLTRELTLDGIDLALRRRHLQAVAISAFSYEAGQAVTFYQSAKAVEPWLRHQRIGVPTALSVEHLMASAAIPMVFPAVRINQAYFGDGALRQLAPISPALHLGATRILVVGVSCNPESAAAGACEPVRSTPPLVPPSLAQIGGHMLNSTFIDNLEADLELLERLNLMSLLLPTGEHAQPLPKPVEVLVINPSQPLDQIAARHKHELPRSLRLFLRGPGGTKKGGAEVLSYLLFEPGYCNELIELGYQDAIRRKAELITFLGLAPAPVVADASTV